MTQVNWPKLNPRPWATEGYQETINKVELHRDLLLRALEGQQSFQDFEEAQTLFAQHYRQQHAQLGIHEELRQFLQYVRRSADILGGLGVPQETINGVRLHIRRKWPY